MNIRVNDRSTGREYLGKIDEGFLEINKKELMSHQRYSSLEKRKAVKQKTKAQKWNYNETEKISKLQVSNEKLHRINYPSQKLRKVSINVCAYRQSYSESQHALQSYHQRLPRHCFESCHH